MAAVPIAAIAAAIALPTVFATSPSFDSLLPASSLCLPASLTSSPNSSASLPASSKPSSAFASALLLSSSSRSMPLSAASALLSWICQFCVRLSFSPNDSAAFCSAARNVSIFCFCASISLFRTSFRAVSALTDVSFLSNWEETSFISDPSTLKVELISASAFLNSFSPSRPIFRPKLSATDIASFH